MVVQSILIKLRLTEQYTIDMEECLEEIMMHDAVQRFERTQGKDFNPNSTYHLRELFFNILSMKVTKKTDTGAPSTDKEVLANMGHPLADAILDLREKTKLAGIVSQILENGVDYDGRLRSGFNIHGTISGHYQVVETSTIRIFHEITKTSKNCSEHDQDTR